MRNNKRKCSLENCNRQHVARGYCYKHWEQFRKYGRITDGEPRKRPKGLKYNIKKVNMAWFKKGSYPPNGFNKNKIPWNKGLKGEKLKSHYKNGMKGLFQGDQLKRENNYNWKGGTSKNKRVLNCPKVKKWRKKVFERDDYTCQECGKRGGKLNAHHIKSWAKYKKLRYKVKNGKTLCRRCHWDEPRRI